MSLVIHKMRAFKTIYFQFKVCFTDPSIYFVSEDIALMLPDLGFINIAVKSSFLLKANIYEYIFRPLDEFLLLFFNSGLVSTDVLKNIWVPRKCQFLSHRQESENNIESRHEPAE